MSSGNVEADISAFWDACDKWSEDRTDELVRQGVPIKSTDLETVAEEVEEKMNTMMEQGISAHGEAFKPAIMHDLHHLLFELELKKLGVHNEEEIHRYKDNGQVVLSVLDGKMTPDNAVLVMEINSAHREKKGGTDDGVCEDCICGKK